MISFAITTHEESVEYLRPLFDKLLRFKQPEDEVVILDDHSTNSDTVALLEEYKEKIKLHHRHLNGNFAEQKNYLNSLCKGTHIVQLDGDETIHEVLISILPEMFTMNPTVDLFTVPRINIVAGIEKEDVARWGWNINEKGWINFPDRQTRIYKNKPSIRWENKVHERIKGYEYHTDLPEMVEYSILHVKTIDRQRSQNELYSKMI